MNNGNEDQERNEPLNASGNAAPESPQISPKGYYIIKSLDLFGEKKEGEQEEQGGISSVLSPQTEEERVKSSRYDTMHQGKVTNELTNIRPVVGKNTEIDPISGTSTTKYGSVILQFASVGLLNRLRTSAWQLLDVLTILATESTRKSQTILLTVSEYMDKRDLKNRKEARESLAYDLVTLQMIPITATEQGGQQPLPVNGFSIFDHWEWADKKKTCIAVKFADTVYGLLMGYPIMAYPSQLRKLNPKRNPNSYFLGKKIAELKNMNVGKLNEDIIAVQTLLDCCPYIPPYEEVMSGNRNVLDRIILPFERDMNCLSDTFLWHYCHSRGEPATREETNRLSYATFISLMVKIEWKDYPDQTARLQRKAERARKAEEAKRSGNTSKKKSRKKHSEEQLPLDGGGNT